MDRSFVDGNQDLFTKHLKQLYGGEPYGLLENWNAVTMPFTDAVKDQLLYHSNEIDYGNLSKYDGYHIGVATEAWSSLSSGKIEKINYVIWILPANPRITPTTQH